jgi:hypothetical protein
MAEISRNQLHSVIAGKYQKAGKSVEEANERASADIESMFGKSEDDAITVSDETVAFAKQANTRIQN